MEYIMVSSGVRCVYDRIGDWREAKREKRVRIEEVYDEYTQRFAHSNLLDVISIII